MTAKLLETELLPARLSDYNPSRLDSLLQESELRWIGTGDTRLAFCFESDLDLVQHKNRDKKSEDSSGVKKYFADAAAKYDFFTLLKSSSRGVSELADQLWSAVWDGSITNDTFQALRKGLETKFKIPDIPTEQLQARSRGLRTGGRGRFSRWQGSMPISGNWYIISTPEISDDLLENEERKKDRVRILLDRYGILFREIVRRELPQFQWAAIFRTLRLMELSGEVLAGYFFKNIPGPQFISHRAFRTLQRTLPEDTIYWMNATDPASCCGLLIEELQAVLPKRMDSNHVVFRGADVVLISKAHGKELIISIEPDDPQITEIFAPLRNLLQREVLPLRRLTVKTINNEPAAKSPYLDVLRTCFDVVVDYKQVVLYRYISS